jgi:hypothetical protein
MFLVACISMFYAGICLMNRENCGALKDGRYSGGDWSWGPPNYCTEDITFIILASSNIIFSYFSVTHSVQRCCSSNLLMAAVLPTSRHVQFLLLKDDRTHWMIGQPSAGKNVVRFPTSVG